MPFCGSYSCDNRFLGDQAGLADRTPYLLAHLPVLGAVRAAIVVELDVESREVVDVSLAHLVDELLGGDSLGLGTNHDGRAVRIVGPQEMAIVAEQLLEADPDVGLQIFDQVADMGMSVGVRQRGGNENPAWAHECSHDIENRPAE